MPAAIATFTGVFNTIKYFALGKIKCRGPISPRFSTWVSILRFCKQKSGSANHYKDNFSHVKMLVIFGFHNSM
jgi:hypothetical protein